MSSRLRGMGSPAGLGLLAGAVIACAASTALQSETPEGPGTITDVRVEREADTTIVTLLGVGSPVFTAFEQQDPHRVVVDVASTRDLEVSDAMPVHDGLVEEITLASFNQGLGDPMTRIEVWLAAPADYDVARTDEGLVIRLGNISGLPDGMPRAEAEEVAESDPWAIEPLSEAAHAGMADAGAAVEEAPAATELLAVEVSQQGEGALVHLRADGAVVSAVSFTLEDPDRLVIDLPDLISVGVEEWIEVGSSQAERIRVGQHPDKVRVVIDAGAASQGFEGRRVVPVPTGLLVALGSGEDLRRAVDEARASQASAQLAEAMEIAAGEMASASETWSAGADEDWSAGADEDWSAGVGEDEAAAALAEAGLVAQAEATEIAAAEETETAAAEETETVRATPLEPVTIYGVEFDAQEGRDRVVVLAEQPVDYLVYEPDPETVVLSFTDAAIDPDAAVRITPEPAGPVSLVTAFAQPDVEAPEVRVVVKRAPGLKPEVSRRGSLLVVDFPHTGDTAASPPVLASVPEATVLGESAEAEAPSADAAELSLPAPSEAAPVAALAPAAQPEPQPEPQPSAPGPASLEPPAAIEILHEGGLFDGKEYTGRRISLDFKDVETADVLRLIAEVSDLNVIAGDEVKGRVTIRLVDVPWDQALDVILLTKGLGFMRVGNVLRIAPSDLLAQEEEARLQERRAKEKLEDLVVKLQPVNYAEAADVQGMVQRLLSERGSVNVDKRTNTLIIKDIPTVIDEATALIKAIDTQTPQVMIEAKIVEASLDFAREFGSVWSVGSQPLVDGFSGASGPRRDLGGQDFRLHDQNNFAALNPITAGPTALANLGAFILDEKLNLELQLQAAEVNGDGKVISSPRIVTLDNSMATIEQGVSIPFQTFENGDAQLEFVDAVLQLRVTPHITADKSIIMEIKVSRNAPDDSVFTLTGSPAIAKNQVQTETLVKDGRTLVLGGIYVVDKSQRQSRVPYLHRIPILGGAFRNNELNDSRKELLIFVTPRVVVRQETAT